MVAYGGLIHVYREKDLLNKDTGEYFDDARRALALLLALRAGLAVRAFAFQLAVMACVKLCQLSFRLPCDHRSRPLNTNDW